MNQNNDDQIGKFTKYYKDVAPYMGLGLQLALTIVIMFFAGKWLDDYFKTAPILTISFAFLGIAAGMYSFIKTVLDQNKKNK